MPISDMPRVVPIHALLNAAGTGPNLSADPRPDLHASEVIIGVDMMTGHEFVAFGRRTLEQIVCSGQARPVRIMRVGIDQETDELERLLAIVQAVKGSDDYRASTDGGA